MDTSKLESLMNSLRLLEMLYPIAMIAALLIGGFLCCLTVLQLSKEAAIMRVLGTTKHKVRGITTVEQVLLTGIGLFIGAGGLWLYKGAELKVAATQLYLFAGLYFGLILLSALICSIATTRRSALELLQTKE